MSQPLTDDSLMPTGAHQDKPMKNVPAKYLDWLIGQSWLRTSRNPDWIRVREYIEANLDAIQADIQDD